MMKGFINHIKAFGKMAANSCSKVEIGGERINNTIIFKIWKSNPDETEEKLWT